MLVSLIQNSVDIGLPFTLTATSSVVAAALFTVGASGTLARVLSDAVPLNAVSTLPPFRAITLKVYDVLTDSPVTVFVPQVAAICHTAELPRVPSAFTNFVVPVSLMQNSVVPGLSLELIVTSRLVAAALLTVGAAGALASVVSDAVLL